MCLIINKLFFDQLKYLSSNNTSIINILFILVYRWLSHGRNAYHAFPPLYIPLLFFGVVHGDQQSMAWSWLSKHGRNGQQLCADAAAAVSVRRSRGVICDSTSGADARPSVQHSAAAALHKRSQKT